MQTLNRKSHLTLKVSVLVVSFFGFAIVTPSQTVSGEKGCIGLHAGVRAEFVRRNPPLTQPSDVIITFILLNDDDKPLDTSEPSWKLIVDGQELKESAMIFGNGPRPAAGWKILNPGATAEFAVALDIDKYFPESRTYKLSWEGRGFRSPTIEVVVTANRG